MKRFFLSSWAMIAALCGVIAVLVYLRVTDPDDQFVDRGVRGPFTFARIEQGVAVTGPPIDWVAPDGEFGFISTFCPGRRLAYAALVRLVREDDGLILNTRRRPFAAGERDCGPAAGTIRVPASATPGVYRVEREAVLITSGRLNRTVVLDHLLFTVRAQ